MSLHRNSTGPENIHVPYAFEFADQTDREAGTGYSIVAGDVGKLARQLDDNSIWLLTDDSPITWVAVGSSSGTGIPEDGWVEASETFTYASADDPTFTFTIAGVDRTARYTPGTRIKLTQTTVKYFIVTKVSFSTDTTVTVYGGTDYDLANAAITLPYYSHVKGPAGFPLDPTKWTVTLSDTSDRSQSSPVDSTWYNLGSLTLNIPIGNWRVRYDLLIDAVSNASQVNVRQRVTLSTANNSESSTANTSFFFVAGASSTPRLILPAQKELAPLLLTSKTAYFLNSMCDTSTMASLHFRGDIATTVVLCTINYL